MKAAGSDDLGSDSYVEPLEVFLAACEDEAELTTFGRFLVTRMLSAALTNRIELATMGRPITRRCARSASRGHG